MKYLFNVFTGNLDLINDAGASIPVYQHESQLPTAANDGELAVVTDTNQAYIFNATSNVWTTTGVVVQAVSGTSSATGITTSTETDGIIIRPTLTMHAADATNPGLLTAVAQEIAGVKTFDAQITANGGIDATTLNVGAAATAVNIGAGSATNTITIGNSHSTVIIQGTTEYENVTNLNVADKLITVNKGGASTSGAVAGLEIEEGGSITGYAETSSDRNSWTLKAPNTAGVATITPGSAGITLNQSSHDPVTLGTANGLSLSGQQLSLAAATNSVTGALTAADHTTYSNTSTKVAAATSAATPSTLMARDASANTAVNALATSLITTPGTDTAIDVTNRNLQDSSGNQVVTWSNAGLGLPELVFDKALYITAGGVVQSSAVTSAELGYVHGVTSSIQTQLTNKADRNANDISLSSATLANNQASAANVTGLAFANAAVRSAQIQYSATIVAGSNLYEEGTLRVTQRGADWQISRSFDGDDALLNFDVTSAGQITYTSSNYTGFVSGTLKFRATVTTV